MAVSFANPTDSATRLPAGDYIMKLKDIESEQSTYNPGEERLKFIFAVESVEAIDQYPDDVDEDNDDELEAFDQSLVGKDHWAWCANKMGGNATLRKWLTGMLGKTIEKNDNLSPDQFIGKSYKVSLGTVPYTFNGQAGEKFDIATIKPYKPARQRQRQQAAPDPEGFDADDLQYDADGNLLKF